MYQCSVLLVDPDSRDRDETQELLLAQGCAVTVAQSMVEAERLLNMAVPGRSIGRLPMTGFKLMVDSCRTIISRWPDSRFANNAKLLLADLP